MQDRTDFRVAVPLIEAPALLIEVGHADEQILGACEGHALQIGQQRSSVPLALDRRSDGEELQIVAEEKSLSQDPDAGHDPFSLEDIRLPSLPLQRRLKQPLP